VHLHSAFCCAKFDRVNDVTLCRQWWHACLIHTATVETQMTPTKRTTLTPNTTLLSTLHRWWILYAFNLLLQFLTLEGLHRFNGFIAKCLLHGNGEYWVATVAYVYVCPVGSLLLQNCWTDFAEILHRDGGLIGTRRLAFCRQLPWGPARGDNRPRGPTRGFVD